MTTVTILSLANSWRPDGRCFAGKDYSTGVPGVWIRPVNVNNRDAISDANREYPDGTHADVLDILQIPIRAARPHGHHTEDYEINTERRWTKIGRATWRTVTEATDQVQGTLWPNISSSFHGTNDKVSEAIALAQPNSLALIRPTTLNLVVAEESQFNGPDRRRIRANFSFNNSTYNFVVTDPWVSEHFFPRGNGTYPIPESRLCISLPEIIGGNSTKLVAAVITPERAG